MTAADYSYKVTNVPRPRKPLPHVPPRAAQLDDIGDALHRIDLDVIRRFHDERATRDAACR